MKLKKQVNGERRRAQDESIELSEFSSETDKRLLDWNN